MIYLSHKKGAVYAEKDGFFQQDNAAIHNASITKTYLLEQKIRLLDQQCVPQTFLINSVFHKPSWQAACSTNLIDKQRVLPTV